MPLTTPDTVDGRRERQRRGIIVSARVDLPTRRRVGLVCADADGADVTASRTREVQNPGHAGTSTLDGSRFREPVRHIHRVGMIGELVDRLDRNRALRIEAPGVPRQPPIGSGSGVRSRLRSIGVSQPGPVRRSSPGVWMSVERLKRRSRSWNTFRSGKLRISRERR
jgi:hypothetical protein